MKIQIDNKEYQFLTDYKKIDKPRAAFNDLAKKTFNISFEPWYQAGYWNKNYFSYTIFDNEKAVANASVNTIDFDIQGTKQRYIQIGTVMTDILYRNKGLSRFLMEKILSDWNNKSDLIYLFANPSAVEMYPKFGFRPVKEREYFKSIEKSSVNREIKKLNMDRPSDRGKLYNYAKNTISFGQISMKNNVDLIMFYCLDFLKENIFYIEELNVVAIVRFNENQMQLWDIFSPSQVDLDEVLECLASPATNEVVLGFTPKNTDSYKSREILGGDTLFFLDNGKSIFEENNLMFPLLSHA